MTQSKRLEIKTYRPEAQAIQAYEVAKNYLQAILLTEPGPTQTLNFILSDWLRLKKEAKILQENAK